MPTTTPVEPLAVFDRSDDLATAGHEQVVFCRDDRSGLRAIIAIHSTALGPALGGTRFKAYPHESAALVDVLRLSQGMTFKAALAGLPLGGGKAVIIGDPDTQKTPELLAAYGGFVDRLAGHYVTAADIGTTDADLDVVGTRTRHVTGRTRAGGGSGDSGRSTATGVFESMRAAAELVWGDDGLRGRRVGVEGVGKVGRHLVDLLLVAGARVAVSDASPAALARLRAELAAGPAADRAARRAADDVVEVLPSVIDAEVDVYAPCALGATLDVDTVDRLRARVVCGAANNQLASAEVDELLAARGIVWVPDYAANSGGLIQVGGELLGWSSAEVDRRVQAVGSTVRGILTTAAATLLPTGRVADEQARARLAR
ncbi:Glu/Leu/Phe/Val dehydrogenase dimerization domain-containing protein [Nocardioides sp. LHD-245]|uniref:Glu/Leu/Phe/Val dehydrogenase dimerization domain-containing protein n=1 Tax=Nocardioides sp. LHD-245 TaxID=3051387 RepID=UPI0027DF5859|nr:Glu/Leu/Phe/Val dehydrogenase dimerization domain-containing protein [Nocardioides sp. LHD-245]